MRKTAIGVALFVLVTSHTLAQTNTNEHSATFTNTPSIVTEATENKWLFSASVDYYLVRDSQDYAQPTFTADRGWLHLEARYNNEALDTGSLWLGYNFSVGDKVTLDFTPIVGGVFGHLNGIAPGYELTLSWWKFELYGNGEYVFDLDYSADSFFYAWTELSLAPVEWFRFGLVAQRTRVYQTDVDIQRGVLVGLNYKQANFTTYVFDAGDSQPTVVFSVGLGF